MREYDTTVSDCGKAIGCYIASQPGKVSAYMRSMENPRESNGNYHKIGVHD